ncbi:hypothetical protein [Ideonella sp. YS5]|uniref:hypothetical protein n=1 Tax=Ideonella sp. YS5 TaxID=3453714 RepID=UPI003EEEDAE2
MNKLLVSLIGVPTLGAALLGCTGSSVQTSERRGDLYEAAGPTAAGLKCPAEAPTLLLDRGPRAQTTPYENRLRRERYESQLKACKEKAQ